MWDTRTDFVSLLLHSETPSRPPFSVGAALFGLLSELLCKVRNRSPGLPELRSPHDKEITKTNSIFSFLSFTSVFVSQSIDFCFRQYGHSSTEELLKMLIWYFLICFNWKENIRTKVKANKRLKEITQTKIYMRVENCVKRISEVRLHAEGLTKVKLKFPFHGF